jgi:methylase of polypeptide subunit release factors
MNQESRNNFYNLVQNISGQKMSTRSLNKLEKDYKLPADLVSSFITSTKTLDFYPTPTGCLDNQYINEVINESKNILEPSYGVGSIINYIHNVNPEANITGYELSDGLYNISKSVLLPNSKITLHLKNFLTKDFKDNDFQTIICNPPFTRTYYTDKTHKDNRFYYDFLDDDIILYGDLIC